MHRPEQFITFRLKYFMTRFFSSFFFFFLDLDLCILNFEEDIRQPVKCFCPSAAISSFRIPAGLRLTDLEGLYELGATDYPPAGP